MRHGDASIVVHRLLWLGRSRVGAGGHHPRHPGYDEPWTMCGIDRGIGWGIDHLTIAVNDRTISDVTIRTQLVLTPAERRYEPASEPG